MPQQRIANKHNPKQRRRKIQMIGAGVGAVLLAVALVAAMAAGGDGDKEVDQPTGAAAVSSEAWTTETYAGGPRLAVDRTEVDYGNVDYGEPVEATYRLKNIGDETIAIDEPSIKTLEGCWPPVPVVGQTTLQPGEETTVYAEFTMTEGMGGPHSFEITIRSNDPVEPSIALVVSADFPLP